MDGVTCFSGNSNECIDEFLEQFQAVTVLKGCNKPEEKLLLLPRFIKGSALYYFRAIKSLCSTFEEVISKLREEFEVCDYAELFYNAKQDQKTLSEFFYSLSELAIKANINKDSTFIIQFLKGLKPYFKNKLTSSHYANKKDLREVISQIDKVFPKPRDEQMNLMRNPVALVPMFSSEKGEGDMPTPFSSPMTSPSQDARRDAPATPQRGPPRKYYNLRSNYRPTQPNFQPRRH